MVGWRTVAGLGCPRGRAACTSERAPGWTSERTAAGACCGPDMGSPRRRSSFTSQSGGSDLGRGSAASARRARSGSFLGSVWAGRAAGAYLGFTRAGALLGATATRTVVGGAQARRPLRARALVGCATFGATSGCSSCDPARRVGSVVGESTGGSILGLAGGRIPRSSAGPGVGGTRAIMGCLRGSSPERASGRRAFMGRARDRGLGCAQERGTGRARGAQLVGTAASDSRPTATASDCGSSACDFSPKRGSIVVAARRACGPAEVPGAASRGDRGFAAWAGASAGPATLGVARRVGAACASAARRTHP